jgi:PTS system nitrogen regulatory IIA component
MNLSLQEAARTLGVSAETVRRWARQGRLGVLQPSGDFQVGMEELKAWALEQGLRLQEPRVVPPAASAQTCRLSPLSVALTRGGVRHQVAGANREAVLRDVVRVAPLPDAAARDALLQQLLAREEMSSTGVGAGVALPHPRTPSADFVREPLVLIASLAQPVEWRALDARPVHTAILLLSPNPPQHLQLLSRLAFLLREPRFTAALERQSSAEELLALVAQIEPPG